MSDRIEDLVDIQQLLARYAVTITQEDIDWLDQHRVKGKMPTEDAGTFVSRMRDEEWQR